MSLYYRINCPRSFRRFGWLGPVEFLIWLGSLCALPPCFRWWYRTGTVYYLSYYYTCSTLITLHTIPLEIAQVIRSSQSDDTTSLAVRGVEEIDAPDV